MNSNLSERYQDILRVTIQHYIATAEPVGSNTLVNEYALPVSSATIRNAMGKLEKAGLLYQPHTSAGRVPSDSGYRIYVDHLLTPNTKAGKNIETEFNKQIYKKGWSFEALLQKAAQILATLSGYITLITLPQKAYNQLRYVQLVQVESGQVMLIVVTDTYQTQSVMVEEMHDRLSEGEVQIISNFLDSKLRGRSLMELATLDWGELDKEFQCYAQLIKTLIKDLSHLSQVSHGTPIMIRGVAEVLRQPEFSQLEQVQTLLHLLEEEQEQLWPLIFEVPELQEAPKGVRVRIGAENPLEPMRSCALVSSIYRQGKIPIGSVAVIGPTRMLYQNAIPMVESVSDYLSQAFG